jgi:tetratricopeptide (TPR) repeat protein
LRTAIDQKVQVFQHDSPQQHIGTIWLDDGFERALAAEQSGVDLIDHFARLLAVIGIANIGLSYFWHTQLLRDAFGYHRMASSRIHPAEGANPTNFVGRQRAVASTHQIFTIGQFDFDAKRRANADLAAKNQELADEQAKVQARFELALKAIALFHTGVSEDVLLKNAEFKKLRTNLLEEAAEFYAGLEKLLAGQTDAKSRQALAAAYFQLGELTDKIGDKQKALAVHHKALALRRELAAAEGADGETRLDVARSLGAKGSLLADTGDLTGALRAWEEQRGIATALESESATDAIRAVLAESHHGIGGTLGRTGNPAEALYAYEKALAIRQKLVDTNLAVPEFQRDLARTHVSIGRAVWRTGKWEGAMASYRKALEIQQKLADANPAVTEFQSDLASCHHSIGFLLMNSGSNAQALRPFQQAMAIQQKLADANPAVTEFQHSLALSHTNIGELLGLMGKTEEALVSYRKALALLHRLADANPAVAQFQRDLRSTRWCIAWTEAASRPKEALLLLEKESAANPEVSFLWLHIAALQAWFGQEKELAATCARALGVAKGTKNPAIAERAAKICSLRQSDARIHEAALVVARRAVELGQGHEHLRWFQMALGIAEYRSGHYAAADAALLKASKLGAGDRFVAGTSAFYRAMSLFRQGKLEEARKLAMAAAAQMRLLPKDEEHPLANTGDHDDLILWLAYREAKDAIQFDEKSRASAGPETRNKAKAAKTEAESK